ncbi:tyrosine-protein phosphatase [Williamsia sterculiae]|uniref:tyrosine-protein phosphatase n=1 Tax=Williamsia sterculiae TaxID=1344003 RepID=UPI001F220A76|nr:tyrosine-protein phosphatase [Williamsia sterculiae]
MFTSSKSHFTTVISALIMVVAAALTVFAGPAAAAPVAAPIANPSVHLQGAPNARTFAGYTTTDGRLVSPTLLIRSDNLASLTPSDVAVLRQRKVGSIIDLRTVVERAVQPDRPIPGATVTVHDVLSTTAPATLVDLNSAYRAFVLDPGSRLAIGNTVRQIARQAAQGKVTLFHCSAGKDRTGWVSAVLLTLLGVDRAKVEQDYLDSNTYRHTSAADRLNGVNASWLRSSFALADQRYGSFAGYAARGLGLTDGDLNALRDALLVPMTPRVSR